MEGSLNRSTGIFYNCDKAEACLKIMLSADWMPNPEDTYSNMAKAISEVFNADEVYLDMLDPEGESFSRISRIKVPEKAYTEERSTWNVGLGRSQIILSSKIPEIQDYANPRSDEVLPYDESRYGICIPVVAGDIAIGLCSVSFFARQTWRESDIDDFAFLGKVIGACIQKLRTSQKATELALLEERKRLASEIHDNVVQLIHALSLNAASALASYEECDLESMAADLERLERNSKNTVKVFRDEMLSLRLPLGCERVTGFVDSVRSVLHNFENNWGIKTRLILDIENDPLTVSTSTMLQLDRILNEGISNVLRHSGADEVEIDIIEANGCLTMKIIDNGHGFNVNEIEPNHWGIKIMQERADSIKGSFRIRSNSNGTIITVVVVRHV